MKVSPVGFGWLVAGTIVYEIAGDLIWDSARTFSSGVPQIRGLHEALSCVCRSSCQIGLRFTSILLVCVHFLMLPASSKFRWWRSWSRIRTRHLSALGKTPDPRCRKNRSAQVPGGHATPASIVDALKAVAGNPPKVRASFAKGRCVRGTYVPSDRAQEITKSREFHKAITRAGALLGGRRQSRNGGYRTTSCCAASASGSATMTIARTFSLQSAPVHFAQDARPDAGFPQGAHSGTGRQAGYGESQGILRRQSRNAASGKLHRRASAAREFCRHDLLGRARLSRDEFERRDAVHQVQGRSGRRGRHADRGRGQDEVCRLPARRPRKPDRCRRCPVQRDGAARPSRRPHHGRDHPMAG